MLLAKHLHAPRRVVPGEQTARPRERAAAALQAPIHGPRQPLCETVEALGVVGQAAARVHQSAPEVGHLAACLA